MGFITTTARATVEPGGWGIWMSSYDQSEPVSPSSTGGADAKKTSDDFIGASSSVGKPVHTARFIAPINAVRDGGRDLARYRAFLLDSRFSEKVITVGINGDTDVGTYQGCGLAVGQTCSNGTPGGTGIKGLRQYAINIGATGTLTWGPTNEPNINGVSAQAAALYFVFWKDYCSDCRVIAGELAEITATNAYSRAYLSALASVVPKPTAYGIHTYSNGLAPSADNGRVVELTQGWRSALSAKGLSAPIWCTECGIRIDVDGVGPTRLDPNTPCIDGQPNRISNDGRHTVGPYGTEMFPQDYSNSEQDRAYTEQVTAGLLLGQAANDPNGPSRMYFSGPESLVNRLDDCAGNKTVGTFDSSAFVRINEYYGANGAPLPSNPAPPLPPNGNRARPAYCGYIYSGYDAASICASLKPNVYPSDGRFPGK